ncbi:MAG: hypothetical protein KIT35_12575 [Piscinibacter sp.]|uniref:hypothetical protein n=1 Tax=Piscinibacter sp. TaxID=1903157 RepID=UPI00258373B8|nr:hypothetical protein [Piscinibacter sp.]MCW5664663.1 hypothetical protein [Piscinibacter sp.]
MNLLQHALRAGHGNPQSPGRPRRAVVAGGGGTLGSAVVEQLLALGRFRPLHVLVTQDFHAAPAGLVPLPAVPGQPLPRGAGELAVIVFDRERHANGRDAAFLRPEPAQLPALAAALHAAGARDLLVVQPHAAASLPQALRAGLASLDEQAVAGLGFEHVVLLRAAQPPGASTGRGLQRVADLVLAQLRLMTPQAQQPVRARKLAQLAAALAAALPEAPPGTRVMAPEIVWQAAQLDDPAPLVRSFLHGQALPEAQLRVPRM